VKRLIRRLKLEGDKSVIHVPHTLSQFLRCIALLDQLLLGLLERYQPVSIGLRHQ
jgi:hypothetical protein